MLRRKFLTLLAWLSCGLVSSTASAEPIAPGGPDFKTALEKGLRARRPEEFEFIARVVARVDNGTLPRSLVDSTFLWARKRPRDRAYQYFQHGLQARAKKLGVSI